MRVTKVWDSADGAATPGRVFTASIPQESIPNDGEQLDFLKIGVKGAVSSSAVVIETFGALIAPLTLRFGADNRIVLNLNELCGLMAFYFREVPAIGENTDATGNDFIGGLKVPVFQKADSSKQFLLQADYSTQSNIATETIAVSAYWDTGMTDRKPVHAVRIPHTTAGTGGLETLGFRIVPEGKLIGLIVSTPNGFADGNIDVSVQKLKILADGKKIAEFNDLADVTFPIKMDYVTPAPLEDLLRPLRMYDLRPAGLDAKATQLVIQLDVQDVSDACVIIPIIEVQ